MPALDQAGTDRIAPFRTLWNSYNGKDCSTIAVLFKQAHELLRAEGYDRYSKTEDETSTGLTIFEVLERVARDEATADLARTSALSGAQLEAQIERDTNALADELATRLAGVLLVTGQHTWSERDATERVFSWTREAIGGPRYTYRGIEHAARLLELASVMTMATEVR